jgi:hypothetical protein
MKIYSVKEASDFAGIPTRTITYNCKRDNVRKVSNRYQITQTTLDEWITKSNNSSQHYRNLAKAEEEHSFILAKKEKDLERVKEEYKRIEDSLIAELSSKDELLQHRTQQIEEFENKYNNLLGENEQLKSKLKEEVPHQKKLINAIELITLEAMKKGVQHKIFTDEEYNDLIGTISEVDFQKKQVKYLKTRIDKQDAMLMNLAKHIEQRTYLEAREKGFDKK